MHQFLKLVDDFEDPLSRLNWKMELDLLFFFGRRNLLIYAGIINKR